MASTSRLLVVSNRAPVEVTREGTHLRIRRTVGGLATALDDVLRERPGTWIAWAGSVRDEDLTPDRTGLPYPIRAVQLSERELDNYYAGFANQVLWPLCHIFPTRCHFNPAFWTAYRHANERFAAGVQAIAKSGDIVWVNDFHLCLVPGLLRASTNGLRIGVFWHIPFPPPAVFGICQWRDALLEGMLGADVIGFQTKDDVDNFLACVRQFLNCPARGGRVQMHGHDVRVVALPIGIDAARFKAQAADPAVQEHSERLRARLGAEVMLLGVDRLDYTKGIVERLLGFERFLERQPSQRRRVSFVQITVPSRFRVPQYREMKREIDETVGRIVGRFTWEARSPIAYHYQGFDHEALAAYYLATDIALVTPLRDGMNLVAKEYVACHAERDGVLILSEFAGAARELTDAVLVNPYEPDAIASAIETAVHMAVSQRKRRMRSLVRKVSTHDLEWWTSSFIDLVTGTGSRPTIHLTAPGGTSAA
jgi:trehalose 6-phosphate synthase